MTKVRASLIHFIISCLVVSALLIFAYYIWYGEIFIAISGVMAPVKMLVLVDVVLGPLLTFLIYKNNKKHIKLDISIIALVQFLALSYGVYTLYLGKPSLVVMKANSMEIVVQKNIEYKELNKELKAKLSFFSNPQYGYIPDDKLNVYQLALVQQKFIKPMELNSTFLANKSIHVKRVVEVFNIDEPLLADKLNLVNLEEVSLYLINDNDWYALLAVSDQGIPLKIIQPKSKVDE